MALRRAWLSACRQLTSLPSSRRRALLAGDSAVEPSSMLVAAVPEGSGLTTRWRDGATQQLQAAWLQHNCPCAQCRDPSSGQRTVTATTLAARADTRMADVWIDDAINALAVDWGSGHVSEFDIDWLHEMLVAPEAQPVTAAADLPTMEYGEAVGSERGLLAWLELLSAQGVAILTGAPQENTAVSDLAWCISRPQETIYGQTFDVKSDPNPINIAYSPQALELHQDLVYFESPPGLQFLHCLRFDDDVVGGDSLLLDAFAAAEALRLEDPESFQALCTIPATFSKIHYDRASPVHLSYSRPHISLNGAGDVIGVFWAPPFEGTLKVDSFEEQSRYYGAYNAFARLIDAQMDQSGFQFRLRPGEVLTFNNRRMLHGRSGFHRGGHPAPHKHAQHAAPPEETVGGIRHFRGVYVAIDDFVNKRNVLSRRHGHPLRRPAAHRVGNQDW